MKLLCPTCHLRVRAYFSFLYFFAPNSLCRNRALMTRVALGYILPCLFCQFQKRNTYTCSKIVNSRLIGPPGCASCLILPPGLALFPFQTAQRADASPAQRLFGWPVAGRQPTHESTVDMNSVFRQNNIFSRNNHSKQYFILFFNPFEQAQIEQYFSLTIIKQNNILAYFSVLPNRLAEGRSEPQDSADSRVYITPTDSCMYIG